MDHLEPERRPDESADPPVEPVLPDPQAELRADIGAEGEPEPDPRRYPSTIGGAFYLLVLAGSAVGLGIVSHGNWRLGVKWVASSLVFAALVRLVLPTRDAGMLAVRRRFVDVLLLTVVGAILWFLSGSIPNQPSP